MLWRRNKKGYQGSIFESRKLLKRIEIGFLHCYNIWRWRVGKAIILHITFFKKSREILETRMILRLSTLSSLSHCLSFFAFFRKLWLFPALQIEFFVRELLLPANKNLDTRISSFRGGTLIFGTQQRRKIKSPGSSISHHGCVGIRE